MNKLDMIEKPRLREGLPQFRAGDTVKVHVKVREGNRECIQVFQGVVIRRRGGGIRESFTVRKVSFGVGVERTFPLHSPTIAEIELVQYGRVRRAKLYYLRERTGRHAKIRERRTRIPADAVVAGAGKKKKKAAEQAPVEPAAEAAEAAEAAASEAAEAAAADATSETAAEASAAAEPAEAAAPEAPAADAEAPAPDDAAADEKPSEA